MFIFFYVIHFYFYTFTKFRLIFLSVVGYVFRSNLMLLQWFSFPYGTIEFIVHQRLLTVNDYRSHFSASTIRSPFTICHFRCILYNRFSYLTQSLATLISIAINFMDFIVNINTRRQQKRPNSKNSHFQFHFFGSCVCVYVWCHSNGLAVP